MNFLNGFVIGLLMFSCGVVAESFNGYEIQGITDYTLGAFLFSCLIGLIFHERK